MSWHQRFWPLFWTQFLGALNDNVLKNAMVIMITYKGLGVGGPRCAVDRRALRRHLYSAVLFVLDGGRPNRRQTRKVDGSCALVKMWEILITLVASVGFYSHNVWLLLGALFMMGTHSTFFGPIKYSAIPELVETTSILMTANAYVERRPFSPFCSAPSVEEWSIALPHGETRGFRSDDSARRCWACSRVWRLVELPSVATILKSISIPIAPVVDTVGLLRDKPEVFNAILAISWFWFFGAAVLSVLPPYCKDYLRVDEHVITAFLAMYTVGIGLGSLLCEKLSRGQRRSWARAAGGRRPVTISADIGLSSRRCEHEA